MQAFDIKTLKVGDAVSMVRYGGFGSVTSNAGTVIKADKVKVIVKDASGRDRTFSVKKNVEMNTDSYRTTSLESIETKNARDAYQNRERSLATLWNELGFALPKKDINKIKEIVAKIEEYGV